MWEPLLLESRKSEHGDDDDAKSIAEAQGETLESLLPDKQHFAKPKIPAMLQNTVDEIVYGEHMVLLVFRSVKITLHLDKHVEVNKHTVTNTLDICRYFLYL